MKRKRVEEKKLGKKSSAMDFEPSKRQKTEHSGEKSFLSIVSQYFRSWFGTLNYSLEKAEEAEEEEHEKDVQLDQLIKRLESVLYRPSSRVLDKLISKSDLATIINYFLSNNRNGKNSHSIKPGTGHRIDKSESGLPRSVTILRDTNGEYEFIVETKSKLSNNKKHYLPSVSGANKKGKPAWRIDSKEVQYFNLVTELSGDDEYKKMIREVDISKQCRSRYINNVKLGPRFFKNDQEKVSLYSVKATGDLSKYYTNLHSQSQKDRILKDILCGVKALHQIGIIHQDLKFENILVDRTYGIYRAKITDFGISVMPGDDKDALATLGYQSPEITNAYKNSNFSSYLYNYFINEQGRETLGYQLKDFMICSDALNVPHKANDMWALGILFFKLKHQHAPRFTNLEDRQKITSDPLLLGLLNVNRAERFTIDQAMAVHAQQTQVEKPTKVLKTS